MLRTVFDFLLLGELETFPANMAELIPYLLKFIVAAYLVLAVFKVISYISGFFFNWRWFK